VLSTPQVAETFHACVLSDDIKVNEQRQGQSEWSIETSETVANEGAMELNAQPSFKQRAAFAKAFHESEPG
jgi:hypothetical protein